MLGQWLPVVAALLIPWLGGLAPAAHADPYYDHPPGCMWSTLITTNADVTGLAAFPGGVVLAATYNAPDGPDLDWWGLLYKLSSDSGTVLLATNYHAEGHNNRINAIIPVTLGGGTVNALAFTGSKFHPAPPTSGRDWVWVVKSDLNFVKQAEAHIGQELYAYNPYALSQELSGFVVAGFGALSPGGSGGSWLGRFDASLNLVAETNYGCYWFNGVALPQDGSSGYVVSSAGGTYEGHYCRRVMKLHPSLGLEWSTTNTPPETGCPSSHYLRVRAVADGYVTLSRCGSGESALLNKFSSDGAIAWWHVNTNGTGADLVLTSDGGALVVGTSRTRRLDDVECVWLEKTDAVGQTLWEMCLGGDQGARGAVGTIASEGGYIVAGEATLADGTNRLWVVKVDASQQAPIPVFTTTPTSPVFRGQEVTFDATASIAPGNAIARYEWDFGDGTTNTGAIVRHTYDALSTNTVTLTVWNTNGVLASTSQELVVVRLAFQWERFYGNGYAASGTTDDDIGYSLVEAADSGFVIAGMTGGSDPEDHDFWVFKTDPRGRMVWTNTISHTNSTWWAEAEGRCVIRAHEGGYVIAGNARDDWQLQDAAMVKLDEAGQVVWPMQIFATPADWETAHGVTRSSDGGYMLTGYNRPGGIWGSTRHTWLLKTDGNGNELWHRLLTNSFSAIGNSIVQASDGGYLVTGYQPGDQDFPPAVTYKTDANGVPVWTNVYAGGGTYVAGGRWVAETPGGAAVVVGGNRDILMFFLDPDGVVTNSHQWGSPDNPDYTDLGTWAAATPEGGYIMAGYMSRGSYPQMEVALVKTDAAGNTIWRETMPDTSDCEERALGVVALPDTAYVVLAHRWSQRGLPASNPHPVWLFKLAANHPPVPRMTTSPSPALPGQVVTFDGSLSTDPDGTVAAWEWDFGDGATNSGASVQHTYTNAGSFPVRLTVVDDRGAERSVTNSTCATGIIARSSGATVTLAEITNAPAMDPVQYPPAGAPANLDWRSAFGARIGATGPDGAYVFRIAFCGATGTNYVLYRLPAWTTVAYSDAGPGAIDAALPIAGGVLNASLVLADTIPRCTIVQCQTSGANRLALTFTTDSGYRYRVMRSEQLVPADWQPVNHARAAADPLALETLDGSGVAETVYVEQPAMATAFFRIKVE